MTKYQISLLILCKFKNMIKIGFKIYILFFLNIIYSQVEENSWYSEKDKISFPFDFSNNLIIIDAQINGVTLKFILDTGTEKNILFSFPQNDSIELFNPVKAKIAGVGSGEPLDVIISNKNRFQISEFRDDNFSVMIFNESNVNFLNRLGKEVNGIIGSDFFKNRLIEIDFEKKKITIHKEHKYILKRKFRKFSKLKIKLVQNKPYLTLNSIVNEVQIPLKLLVDSGLSDGLWLFKNDIIQEPKEFIEDYLGFGLAGDILGKRGRVEQVAFSNFEFKDVLVTYPDSTAFGNVNLIEGRNGSIGGELLKRFHLFIDYKNEVLYLKRNKYFNDPFHYNMSGIEVQHAGIELVEEKVMFNSSSSEINALEFVYDNPDLRYTLKYVFKPFYIISHIRENSPAQNAGLLAEDKILSINNKNTHLYTLEKIRELLQSEEGKTIKMEVEREGKIIKVEFNLKKII
jgi:hypothetical protein